MKKFGIIALLCVLAFASGLLAASSHPTAHNKIQGLAIMLVPTGPFKDNLSSGGFAVVASPGLRNQSAKPFYTAEEVFAFIQAPPKDPDHAGLLNVSQNGVWIYAEPNPDVYYTPAATEEYNKLLRLCEKHNIPVFLGDTDWKRALPDVKGEPHT